MVEVFEARLRKIGDSHGILIPSRIIERLGCHQGDVIHIAISPAETRKRNELLFELVGVDKKKPSFQREEMDQYLYNPKPSDRRNLLKRQRLKKIPGFQGKEG